MKYLITNKYDTCLYRGGGGVDERIGLGYNVLVKFTMSISGALPK